MISRAFVAFAALVLMATVVFADVGPSAPPPDVTVKLIKDGQPDASVDEITYHCNKILNPGEGPTTENTIVMGCSEGVCTNEEGWFYKFNPCYETLSGYFTFTSDDEEVTSSVVRFDEVFSSYEVEIDSRTGKIGSRSGSDIPGCLGAVLLPALLALAFLRK